ncbi:MAG: aminotransferase class I/II-fold pyridoxal phosphate-dependent enzyme [Bacteroidetes bacterium]|nr:aminotransferase class I/II-fold pyridoxal phosphate-dependent enzyme [Bacteroidota bacterium]MDA1268915.1 aminotransferase class I/II-fold pyridoxal phosphate-dependent enzyme [Bacteroidota bacterium]
MKGFATRIEGVDEYYFSTKLREVNRLIAEGKPILNLGIGSPDLAPDRTVIEALKSTADNEQTHGYQGYQGIAQLRAAMATYYEDTFRVQLDANREILPLMGSKEGVFQVSMAFLNPGDQVLIPNPGYPTYTAVTQLLGAIPIFYNLDLTRQGRPNLEVLEQMDLSKVKLMWINYPHMPTGAPGSEELLLELIAFAKRQDVLLVHDNPYSHILNPSPTSLLALPGGKEVGLELNSLSKTFNIPGWRVGMLCGKAEWVDAALKVKSNMDSGMFLGLQKGAIAALSLEKGWFDRQNEIYTARRKLVWTLADHLGLTYDQKAAGLFVWCRLTEGVSAEALVDHLLYEKNIFITPGKIFGSEGNAYVRISLCLQEFKILEAINRIKPIS